MQMQLSSDVQIPDGLLAANALLSEKPRLGFRSDESTLRWGSSVVISSTAIGISGTLYDSRIESRYTGKERDIESGNDYFGARYYASSMGRWMSPDPAGIGFASAENPQSLNLYGYVQNNPLAFVDPDGLQVTESADKGWPWVLLNILKSIGHLFGGGYSACTGTCVSDAPIPPSDPGSPFQRLWHNYPTASTYPTTPRQGQTGIWDHVGGRVGQNGNSGVFQNSCSIRMCQALNASGFNIPYVAGRTSSDAMHNWNFYRLTDLQPFLIQTFGKPKPYPATNWRGQVAGQTGIIFFDYPGAGWSGHVELWNGSELRNPEEDYSGESKGVLFWPIQ
jgi:RHS repeat-associated protein